ncbi:MAG: alpha/beta fold hydrolase [Candidatus Coproplasma sp.]
MQEVYYTSSDGITSIHACIWPAEGECKAVLQIIHGMAEYASRYAPLAEKLSAEGICVCAEDHLGHGKSVKDSNCLGYMAEPKGYLPVLKDIRSLTELMKNKYPSVPYFIMGHSMGSFFCRKYISLYGEELSGAIIMGTGFKGGLVTGFAKFMTSLVALFKGWKHRSKFIDKTAFGSYNNKFEKRTAYDWLSKDNGNVDRYIEDELCGFTFTCNGFYGLFSIIGEACKAKTMKGTPSNLPIYIVAGKDDPVGDYGKGVIKFYDKMSAYGKDVTMTLYEGCRHEIANDVCGVQVFEDLNEFISAHI